MSNNVPAKISVYQLMHCEWLQYLTVPEDGELVVMPFLWNPAIPFCVSSPDPEAVVGSPSVQYQIFGNLNDSVLITWKWKTNMRI